MSIPPESTPTHTPNWLNWMRLARVSNLPSALSNILVGFLLVNPSWNPLWVVACLLLASGCLYSAGMILNDYFDVERDKEHSPGRPLPSEVIVPQTAFVVGLVLIIIGLVCAKLAGDGQAIPKSLQVAAVLTGFIWLYDSVLKRTPLAPLVMGGCRTLNILLGASVVISEGSFPTATTFWGFDLPVWWVALSVGFYVTGITTFARREHEQQSPRVNLIAGFLWMLIGIVGLATVYLSHDQLSAINRVRFSDLFPLFIALVSFTIFRSAAMAIMDPQPARVQAAIVTALRSLIIFDACVVLLFANGNVFYPLVIAGLIAVSLVLSARIRQT